MMTRCLNPFLKQFQDNKKRALILGLVVITSGLTSCSLPDTKEETATRPQTATNQKTLSSDEEGKQSANYSFGNADFKLAYDSISIKKLKRHIKYLSSDELAGREPATKGDQMTASYLVKAFRSAGLSPGNGDSYLQKVKLLAINSRVSENLKIADIDFEYKSNYVANTRKKEELRKLVDSPLLFVGYGINAPEFGWNDYDGLDVTGKTVVMLVNDPGYATQDDNLFGGNALTYYGRWTYKYEEAARQGAKAAIIIHETKPASYGWNVIKSGWSGTQYQLPRDKNSQPVVDIEMWISIEKTRELFNKAGLDFETEKNKAHKKGFKAIDLGLKASLQVTSTFRQSETNNIVATLPGSKHPEEHIIYMAHIDHLGKDETLEGDQIYNGAHDNASGTGGILEIARAYASLRNRPSRSITFVGAAAEEQGTLGSQYFAEHPSVPLAKIVGLINMDSINITGRKKDVSVVGYGKSEIEDVFKLAASYQNRTLTPESHPERGSYYRSDHFSLAKKGVPALSAGGGTIPLDDNEAKIMARVGKRISECYHQTCDEYAEDWGWDGAREDLQLYFTTGYILATDDQWPNWYKKTEFRVLRDNMLRKE